MIPLLIYNTEYKVIFTAPDAADYINSGAEDIKYGHRFWIETADDKFTIIGLSPELDEYYNTWDGAGHAWDHEVHKVKVRDNPWPKPDRGKVLQELSFVEYCSSFMWEGLIGGVFKGTEYMPEVATELSKFQDILESGNYNWLTSTTVTVHIYKNGKVDYSS